MKKIFLFILLIPFFATAQKAEDVLRFSMKSKWANQVSEDHVWNVYPRPQMKRENWKNLNGLWEYAILPVTKQKPTKFQGEILVPFAVESELSGVKKLVGEDSNLWYRTSFTVPDYSNTERIQLNFGAVDWKATIYINGKKAGEHTGGFTPFSLDITPYLKKGEQILTIKVWDPSDAGTQPRGKQVANPKGIWYTPVTGIWQTVWLEKTSKEFISSLKNTPDIDKAILHSEIFLEGITANKILLIEALSGEEVIASSEIELQPGQEEVKVNLQIPDQVLWSPDNPHLYDLKIKLRDKDSTLDEVSGYFGMRKVSLGKDQNGYTRIMINDEPLFQFGLLDQGWWPDGLYTAPNKEAMLYDVEMTEKWGFNMLRKHVKVEPAVFYYECDKRGMLVWQDMPNGNYLEDLRIQAWEEKDAERSEESSRQFEKELKEMMDYFHSFPSIVVWVPFNEGWGQYDTEKVTKWVENYDPSRLIDSPSGWADRGVGDMIDVHLYPGPGMELPEENRAAVLGEFGGIGWAVEDHIWWDKKNWGYLTYDGEVEYRRRFEELIKDLVSLKSFGLSAAIYTQTTDVEGEVNGLMTYDREVIKIDPKVTKELINPLYQQADDFNTIISDSEEDSHVWMISYNPKRNWKDGIKRSSAWKEAEAPFSSYDNYFLPEGSNWNSKKDLYLQKSFNLSSVPEELTLRYYLDKSSMQVFINGKLVTTEKHEGGRKRHYRNKVLENTSAYLKKGENTISIILKAEREDHSFDLGIYESGVSGGKNEKAMPVSSGK
ncbi:glycoside hydrolase family 2 protein [Autumnicola musiva]|uniref:Glycoside hydrolase family 2 TIM barrel-domain containing protein n=1 Tax=Autumnicola musiva TaxID=3075589 RepID=A0ABU3D8P8_9FLAO|nr:sugar-binding domain-containing protein [Zunongwangia sp. F117]MDT0677897.1 glycoside hydrolase family 2 TIM barrel-domain containing protein [Zunongwangia sp. F117]